MTYRNVEINFIRGRKAIMTILKNGEEVETIELSEYETEEDMHRLFQEKGFEKLSEEEVRKMLAENVSKEQTEGRERRETAREEYRKTRKEHRTENGEGIMEKRAASETRGEF